MSGEDGNSTITAAKLEDLLREINRSIAPDPLGLRSPSMFAGIPVFERSPPPPLLRVSESCPMTPEARASMNAWLLERFGRCQDLPPLLMVHGMGMVVRHDFRALLARVTA